MKIQTVAFSLILCLMMLSQITAEIKPFEIRGMKGLWWEGSYKYFQALPWMADHNLNFLMTCYTSYPASAQDWRNDLSEQEKSDLEILASMGRELGVDVCFGFNPGIWSKPPLVYSSEEDISISVDRIKTVHALGYHWIALCLDDIHRGLEPEDKERFDNLEQAHVFFVNRIWDEIRNLKPQPKMIFCPSAYTTQDMEAHQDYIKTVGREIHPDIMLFWTGPTVCSPSITAEDAEKVEQWLQRKPLIWDNYPVNDMYPWRPLLSPIKNRSADLAGAVSGYMLNPMRQWHINKIPVATIAEYLNDPGNYDPDAAIQRVIRAYPINQRPAIRLLVELYGSSFWGEEGFPPRPDIGNTQQARELLPRYKALKMELSRHPELKNLWEDVQPTLEADIVILQIAAEDRRKESPLWASGYHFSGGAADQFGRIFYDRAVNYIYAVPTGKNKIQTVFYVGNIPEKSAVLRLVARTDDRNTNPEIEISLNDHVIYRGRAGFSHTGFETKTYEVPSSILKEGENTLVITNQEVEGTLGMPPWFMVAEAELLID